MEVLSGAASGMAVASLALQLLQSIDTIRTFITHVKGASRELERLVQLLTNLSALLDHVRTLCEKQTSLHHCPLPCQPVFDYLKTCESSLASLEEVVVKYEKRLTTKASGVSKLRYDMRFALKAKDIASFEHRIQRDIANLNTALGVNGANLQLTTLSILLRLEQIALQRSSLQRPLARDSDGEIGLQPGPKVFDNMAMLQPTVNINSTTCQWWVESPLRRVGIQQRRMMRYLNVSNKNKDNLNNKEGDVIISRTYEAFWNLFGYGIHWGRRYTCGDILPSLRVYPVVEQFYFPGSHPGPLCGPHVWRTNLDEVQRCLASGAIHPYSRDKQGLNLLHYAVVSRRPDLCRLLTEYGVEFEIDSSGRSPLLKCLNRIGPTFDRSRPRESKQADVDTLRILLDQSGQVTGSEASFNKLLTPQGINFLLVQHIDIMEWLWNYAAQAFYGADLACLRAKLAQELINTYRSDDDLHNHTVNELLIRLMDDEILKMYLSGKFSLLANGSDHEHMSIDSQYKGAAFIDLLSGLGLDIAACLNMETHHHLRGATWDEVCRNGGVRMVYEQLPERDWILRWYWEYAMEAPGHLVVSEFSALAHEVRYLHQWPFREEGRLFESAEQGDREERKRMVRFDRRMAAKARKERARNGEKLPRSRMPGAWNW